MAGITKLLHPARMLRRRALYKGLFGGDRLWLGIGALMWIWKFLNRTFGAGTPVTRYVGDLKPGDRLVVTHPTGSTKRRKRSA